MKYGGMVVRMWEMYSTSVWCVVSELCSGCWQGRFEVFLRELERERETKMEEFDKLE